MDGQEEARPATEPAPIGAERAAGDQAMDVRMMGERLAPCMEDGDEPDLPAEMPGIGGDSLERLGHCLEQYGIDHGLVLEGDRRSFRGYREHDMEIGDRQQISLAVGEPLLARGA